jgi:hypothetical protein
VFYLLEEFMGRIRFLVLNAVILAGGFEKDLLPHVGFRVVLLGDYSRFGTVRAAIRGRVGRASSGSPTRNRSIK